MATGYDIPFEDLSDAKKRKSRLATTLKGLLKKYPSCLIMNIDNVGSKQMQQVRMVLRGKAELLMGKNTIIRKVMRDHIEETGDTSMEAVLTQVKGNIGFCFTASDLTECRKVIQENTVPAAARTGAFAPIDVFIPAGPTGLDPGQTQFFQALDIGTKISRGAIEIINEVHIIHKNERVTSSAVALLSKLNIKPFFFGIKCTHVYDKGSFYDAKILDMTDDDMLANFFSGANHIAAISLACGFPTECSLSHSFANAFKTILAIADGTTFTFEEGEAFKAGAAAGPATGGGDAAAGATAAAPEPEEEEEEAAPMPDMFGGGEDAAY